MSELAVAARLLLVAVFALGDLGDGLPVRHPGHLHPEVGAELPLDLFQGNLDLGVAQTRDERLAGAGVPAELEGWVLFHDPAQGHGHLVQVVLGSGSDRHPEVADRLLDLGEGDGVVPGAQSVTGYSRTQLTDGPDVSGGNLSHVFLVLSLGQIQLPDAL